MSAKIKLLQALTYPHAYYVQPFLDQNAEHAFIVATITSRYAEPGDIYAQILKREGDQFIPTFTLRLPASGFIHTDSGLADANLQNLYVLDDNGANELRVRRLDRSLHTVTEHTFTDYDSSVGISFFTTNADPSGKFVFLTYSSTSPAGSTKNVLLNAQTLAVVYSFPDAGVVQTAYFLQLNNKKGVPKVYLVLGTHSAGSGMAATLSFYKISNNTAVLITSFAVPSSVISIDSYQFKPVTETLVAVATTVVTTVNGPKIYDTEHITGIPGDTRNIRFYKFDGKTVSQFYSTTAELFRPLIRLLPTKGYFIFHQDSLPGTDIIEQIKIQDNHPTIIPRSQMSISGTFANFAISQNNYVLVGGGATPATLGLYFSAKPEPKTASPNFANLFFEKIEIDEREHISSETSTSQC